MRSESPFVKACGLIGLPPRKVILCLSDCICLVVALMIGLFLRLIAGGFVPAAPGSYKVLCLVFLSAPFIGLGLGLYSGIPLPSHGVLRRLVSLVCIVFSLAAIVMFFGQTGKVHSRLFFGLSWLFALFALPMGRYYIQKHYCRARWWGYPLVILNRTATTRWYWHELRSCPEYGFNPVEFLDIPEGDEGHKMLKKTAEAHPGAVAMMVAAPGTSQGFLALASTYFARVMLVPELDSRGRKFWLAPCDIGRTVGFLVEQRLHDKRRLAVKRGIDILACILGSIVVVPLCLLLALAIRLDSKGPVLYTQRRLGKGGKMITVHKFRTMVANAEEILEKTLLADEELRKEWEHDHKLREDPRVTRVGRFLRRTSLDELPQLWDVVRGSMSLVGPRPIVEAEKEKYGSVYQDYVRVRPGITGMWQISGRNDTSYCDRVSYDFYYINNWSLWMDIWILCKTVPVVLFGKGAY